MVPPGTVDPGPVHPAVGGPSLTHGRRGNIAPPRYHRFGSHLPAQGGPSLTRGLRGGIGPPGIP